MRQLTQITWANRVKVREVAGFDLCEESPLWFDGPEPSNFTDIFQTTTGPYLAQMNDWLFRTDEGLFVVPNEELLTRVDFHRQLVTIMDGSMSSCRDYKGLESCGQCNAPECYPRRIREEMKNG